MRKDNGVERGAVFSFHQAASLSRLCSLAAPRLHAASSMGEPARGSARRRWRRHALLDGPLRAIVWPASVANDDGRYALGHDVDGAARFMISGSPIFYGRREMRLRGPLSWRASQAVGLRKT